MLQGDSLKYPDSKSVWVVVPAFNEERALPRVVLELLKLNYSVVVVDDGSRVDIRELLGKTNAHVCRHLTNLGQGAAIETGFRYALNHGAEYLVTFDADGQHAASEIALLVKSLVNNHVDVVLGTRFALGGKAVDIPLVKLVLLKLAVVVTNVHGKTMCELCLKNNLAVLEQHKLVRYYFL